MGGDEADRTSCPRAVICLARGMEGSSCSPLPLPAMEVGTKDEEDLVALLPRAVPDLAVHGDASLQRSHRRSRPQSRRAAHGTLEIPNCGPGTPLREHYHPGGMESPKSRTPQGASIYQVSPPTKQKRQVKACKLTALSVGSSLFRLNFFTLILLNYKTNSRL